VVHYLQDEAKLDPTRLAAVAFGQYRPVSKTKARIAGSRSCSIPGQVRGE